MAVRFVLGRSGSGKTRYCIDSIVHALTEGRDGSLVFLVPEQATYQAERSILTAGTVRAYSHLHVLSFDRLRFLLLGDHPGQTEVSKAGRQMVLARLLREYRDRLEIYRWEADKPGLAAELARIIGELYDYGKTSDDVAHLCSVLYSQRTAATTRAKFHDLQILLEAYQKYFSYPQQTLLNPDSGLTDAARQISRAGFLCNARLWVDGFSGFTGQEMDILAELLIVAAETSVALCVDPRAFDLSMTDPEQVDPTGLFAANERTYCQISDILHKRKISVEPPILFCEGKRFSDTPALAHLEQNLFASASGRTTLPSCNSAIELIKAFHPRNETRFVAERISCLVRGGLRYRDIAVIVSNMDGYRHYIRAEFEDAAIPYFIDRPQPLTEHPLIELIEMTWQAVEHHFLTSDVLAFLKTGLGPLSAEETNELENYCLAYGVNQEDWTQETAWEFSGTEEVFDSVWMDRLRRKAMKPLLMLAENLMSTEKVTGEQFIGTLWNFLYSLSISNTLARWCTGDPVSGRSHQQVYDKLVDLCEEYAAIFSDDLLAPQEHILLLKQGMGRLTLKLIPPTLDQVLVSSIERSRHPDLKVVFLLGTTQKHFPVPVSMDHILTDQDRALAEQGEFVLSDRLSHLLAHRQYLTYIACSRPSEKLILTWPSADASGGAVVASPYVQHFCSLFTDLSVQSVNPDTSDFKEIPSSNRLAESFCLHLGSDRQGDSQEHKELIGVLSSLKKTSQPNLSGMVDFVRSAIAYQNTAKLDKVLAERAFGDPFVCTISRLSSFAACPYQHFTRYILGLTPRTVMKLEPIDLGTFYHQVLDGLFRYLSAQGKDITSASGPELDKLISQVASTLIEEDSNLSALIRRSTHYAFLLRSAQEVLFDCVRELAQMSRAGAFGQVASELRFGPGESELPFSLSDNAIRVLLKGRIDRVDMAQTATGQAAVVFDYKRSKRSFSWSQFFHGLDLQLVSYLLAIADSTIDGHKADVPAGAFYVPIEAPMEVRKVGSFGQADIHTRKARGILDGQWAKLLDSGVEKGWSRYYNFAMKQDEGAYGHFSTSGALRTEQFERLLTFTRSKILALAWRMHEGTICITPYRLGGQSPCSRCDYAAVCKFDWQINDYNPLPSMDKRAVLKEIGDDNG
ncbi:MAG: exodeoxyribonuclease V subunit gamma [Sedimentisphaerales bacterium]|nr:exodeoxyribonuclease V subunit gamma [Sedimentisphaerales bacterium]